MAVEASYTYEHTQAAYRRERRWFSCPTLAAAKTAFWGQIAVAAAEADESNDHPDEPVRTS